MKMVAMKKDTTSITVPEVVVTNFEKVGWKRDAAAATPSTDAQKGPAATAKAAKKD